MSGAISIGTCASTATPTPESWGPTVHPAGAALLRMVDRTGPVQVRLVYPPASDAIRWDAPDAELARRLAPPTAPNTTLVARPDPDRLEPSELVDRISADVSASLRSRDDWASFAMAVDVGGQRSAAFLYHEDGPSEPFRAAVARGRRPGRAARSDRAPGRIALGRGRCCRAGPAPTGST